MKYNLQTSKKGSSKLQDYLHKIKSFSDQLVDTDEVVTNIDLIACVLCVLFDLRPEIDHFVVIQSSSKLNSHYKHKKKAM